MSEKTIELSVVIAAFNEEAVIVENLACVVAELETRPDVIWEIVCVDDGSTDRTGDLLDQAAEADPRIRIVHHRRNFGQGRALRTAFDIGRGEIFVTLDADLSYTADHVYRLKDAVDEQQADIVLASAYMKHGKVRNVPFYRYFLSRVGNLYIAKMSGYPISTSTCVVRAYRREVLDTLVLTYDGMEMQIEVLNKAFIMRFRVCEIPARLEWSHTKVKAAGVKRVSKMRIGSSIRQYLMMGWLARPSLVFLPLSILMILGQNVERIL